MIINKHGNLIGATGNGHHGNCEYCGLGCVTDLGYNSFYGSTCVDREILMHYDIPKTIKSYADWRGLRLMRNEDKTLFYVKPYSDEIYSLEELDVLTKELSQ
jgi:hypothetical protein